MRKLCNILLCAFLCISCRTVKRDVSKATVKTDSTGSAFNVSSKRTEINEKSTAPVVAPGDTAEAEFDGTDTTVRVFYGGNIYVEVKGGKSGYVKARTKPKVVNAPIDRTTVIDEKNAAGSTAAKSVQSETKIVQKERSGFGLPWYCWPLLGAGIICVMLWIYKR